MKGLRVVVKTPKGELVEILEFRDVTDASGIVNTLRRKPAVSSIARAVLAGNIVYLEACKS